MASPFWQAKVLMKTLSFWRQPQTEPTSRQSKPFDLKSSMVNAQRNFALTTCGDHIFLSYPDISRMSSKRHRFRSQNIVPYFIVAENRVRSLFVIFPSLLLVSEK